MFKHQIKLPSINNKKDPTAEYSVEVVWRVWHYKTRMFLDEYVVETET